MSVRTDKVAHAIMREVSLVIQHDLGDPHIGFVTVTRVDVSSDLKNARLFISVLGGDADIEESISHLRHALGFIRHKIAPKLDLRYTPQLSVVHDETELKAERIEKLIEDLQLPDDSDQPTDEE